MLSNHHQNHRLLPPPSYYCNNENHHKELASYYEQWKSMYDNVVPSHDDNNNEEKLWDYNNGETVFGLSFVTSSSITDKNDDNYDNDIQQTYLAGCTKSGVICVWMINNTLNNNNNENNDDEYDDENNNYINDNGEDSDHEILSSIRQRRRTSMMQRQRGKRQRQQQKQEQNTSPIWKYKLTNGALYDCQFVKKHNNSTTTTTNNNNNNNNDNDEYWFLVSGDGGVYLFDWDHDLLDIIRSNVSSPNNNNNMDDESMDVNNKSPKYTLYPTYPSFYELKPIEINQCCIVNNNDNNNNILYGAGGDTLCYKWDMNTKQIITTYRHHQSNQKSNNHFQNRNNRAASSTSTTASASGYLQTIVHVPNTNLLITGGEDGILFIWDIIKDQLIESIPINNSILQKSINQPSPPLLAIQNDNDPVTSIIETTKNQSEQQQQQNHNHRDYWISTCIAQDENWCSIAGGCYNNNNIMRGGGGQVVQSINNNMNQLATTTESAMTIMNDDTIMQSNNNTNINNISGGFITTFHIPTRTFISSMKTKETISKIIYNTNNNRNAATTSNVDYYKNNNNNNNNNNNSTSNHHLLSISNESYITHWMDPFQLYYNDNIISNPLSSSQSLPRSRPPQKVKCTTPSGYGIATNMYNNNNNNQIAVSGIGHIVDVYDHSTQLSFHLTTKK